MSHCTYEVQALLRQGANVIAVEVCNEKFEGNYFGKSDCDRNLGALAAIAGPQANRGGLPWKENETE